MRRILAIILLCLCAIPAFANVHQVNNKTGQNTTAAFTYPLTNPSLIVVMTGKFGTSVGTPTDTAGNTYVDCGPGPALYNSSAFIETDY